MPITEAQREQRKKSIGSSDLPAILGICPYKSAYDVYIEKIFDMKPTASEAMKLGTYLEDGVIHYAEQDLGSMTRNQRRRVAGTHIACNIDAIVNEDGIPFEAKTAGILSDYSRRDEWGEPGSAEVPDNVTIQCHGHMLGLTKDVDAIKDYPEFCHVGALIGGRGILLYRVPFDREIACHILKQAELFWLVHVEKNIPPTDSVPALDVLKRIHRVPNKIVPGCEHVEDCWHERQVIKNEEKSSREAAEHLQAQIVAYMGDAEVVEMKDGSWVTYMSQSRESLDTKRLKKERPDVYAEYMKKTYYPVMRTKSVKSVQKIRDALETENETL